MEGTWPKVILLSFLFSLSYGRSVGQDNFELNIIHMNDVHAHFDEISLNAGRCHQEELEKDECFGGMARMFTAIQHFMELAPDNTLLLNAGDYFQGTMWFSEFKYEPVVKFGNLLNWTTMGLGNHDFDLGAEDLADFSYLTNFDLLACNMKQNETDEHQINFKDSKIVEVNGARIGIIGYVTSQTPNITASHLPTLTFLDEIESVRKEAKRLKSFEPPIDIIIALGHAGYVTDLEMAEKIPEIDIVVGGHSHTFLYTGPVSSNMVEEVEGDFPTYVTQPSGKVVPVVQAYKYSKYLGFLTLNFNGEGELIEPVNGNGITTADVVLIDERFPRNMWIEGELEKYREQLSEYYPSIGVSNVLLEKHLSEESNIGNVLTDSMAWYSKWNDTDIAFINDGGIRGTIEIGSITGEDIIGVLPFGNTIDRVTMFGRSIKGLFEEYAKGLCVDQSCVPPTFLQMSGLKVIYDIYPDVTEDRVTSIKERCGDSWCDLDMEKLYPVALVSFLANGGSYLFNFPDWVESQETGDVDYDAFKQYVAENSPINMTTEGRITVNYHPTTDCDDGWSLHGHSCYRVYNESYSWADSQSACKQDDASLASIHDLETNAFLFDLCPSTGWIWIGGFQPRTQPGNQNWSWDDNSSWSFEHWGKEQPNDGKPNHPDQNQDCIEMYTTIQAGFWDDWDCAQENKFICEKPAI